MKTTNDFVESGGLSSQNASKSASLNWFTKQVQNFEKARFAWMAILILVQSCLGSIACGYILKNNASIIMLGVCAAVTMGCNALLIALASPKLCLIGFYLSLVLNTFFILINI